MITSILSDHFSSISICR